MINFIKNHQNIIKEVAMIVLSFLIPFVMLIILMQVNGISLFSYSDKTMIMMDMKSEYVAYMSNLKNILINHESFVYTTGKVFGGDYMSIFAFYMASPFNLFVVFFENEAIPLFFIWSSIIKMSFASLNMYLLARFSSRFSFGSIIPCIGYGLISYSFIYMSNYMWLDGVMILPLCILGLYFLKDRRHLWLYPIAIGYALLTSWYIGFMICIFVAFYFLALFFIDFKVKNKANYLFLLRFVVFSLIGGLVSGIWWFTAFVHLSGTKGTMAMPQFYNYSISMLLSGFMENNYSNTNLITQNNSYISMFVGVVPLVFAITYFLNGKYTIKERVFFFALLFLYLFASSFSTFSTLLHGGREPTWFPSRYSFVIGFLVCFLAFKSLKESKSLHPLYYLAPTIIGIIALVIVVNVTHSERLAFYQVSFTSACLYFITIIIGVGYSFFSYFTFDNPVINSVKKYGIIFLAALLGLEVVSSYRGGDNVINTNNRQGQFTSYNLYLKDTAYIPVIDEVKKYDKTTFNSSFYRMETTFNRPGNYNEVDNNPMFYNYAGLSNFSSSSKKEVEKYMLKVGFHYNNFFAKYDGGSTFAMNSLFGIKYLVEDTSSSYNIHPYFLDYDTFKELDIEKQTKYIHYYYNPFATTLAFQSDKSNNYYINEGTRLSEKYVYWYDKFEYQNVMFKTLDKSIGKEIFYPLTVDSFVTSIEYTVDEGGLKTYKNIKNGDTIKISFSVPEVAWSNPLYFSEKDYNGDITYYIDGKKLEVNTYWHKGIYSFKDDATHKHTLTIKFNKNRSSLTLRPELYYEDINATKEYMTSAKKDEFIIDNISGSLTKYNFNGHINLTNKINKDLVFTIPNENEVHVRVDGKEVETYTKYNIFTAIDLSNFEVGNHQITIYYGDTALKLGYIMSGVGLVALVSLTIFYNRIENYIFYRKKEEDTISD